MPNAPQQPTIARPAWIEVAGFKSLRAPARLELRPLTLLAGANSGGKSSILQPLLLMKQTLEAAYDPGPLLLDGPHVQFTEIGQVLSRGRRKEDAAASFSVTFGPTTPNGQGSRRRWRSRSSVQVEFAAPKGRSHRFTLNPPVVRQELGGRWVEIGPGLTVAEFADLLALNGHENDAKVVRKRADQFTVVNGGRRRFSSAVELAARDKTSLIFGEPIDDAIGQFIGMLTPSVEPVEAILPFLAATFHLPGLRGHRERRYSAAQLMATGGVLHARGPFTHYTASVLERWQDAQDEANLTRVFDGLRATGLTWKVSAKRANASELELKVGRTATARQGGANDLVDIADVGFGVSQVLPVIVALAAAAPGQMVYVEQPELHLHPRAQLAVGRLLAEAASRGVCVVAETHSRLILRAVQIELARGELLKPDDVGLHWFSRDADTGESTVRLATVDDRGAFGDWPVDFSDVDAAADDDWLGLVLGRDST